MLNRTFRNRQMICLQSLVVFLILAMVTVDASTQTTRPPGALTLEVRFPSAETGVELTAFWTPPQFSNVTGSPAIIALHGCDGLPSDQTRLAYPRNRYVKLFSDAGAGVLYVDSFGSRGEGNLCAQKPALRDITESNRRLDVVGALQWLSLQPGIDSSKLGVVGWSHGGQTVLAVADASADPIKPARVKPAALVAFYAGCSAYEKAYQYEVVVPLLVMSGELDNWTPAAPCQRLTQRLKARGQPVRYVQYEGSYHAFDSSSAVTERDNAAGTRTGRAMAGGNPVARDASAREMMEFLGKHLGLKPSMESSGQSVLAQAVPAATQFATLGDVDAVPNLSEAGKALYREWLSKPFPRAVAISGKGALARGYGPTGMETALRNCEKFNHPCGLYAVDDEVVWRVK